ncbi:MAG: ATP-binding protein [Planctomycetes bacterium]|nr:ATP-binding protein [Planctomycetota bacterium]
MLLCDNASAGESSRVKPKSCERVPLGYVAEDGANPANEQVRMWTRCGNRGRIMRDQFVQILDPLGKRSGFLGRIVSGPFFGNSEAVPDGESAWNPEAVIYADIEIHGEMVQGRPSDTRSRPVPGSTVHEISTDEIAKLLGFAGDMLLGNLSGKDTLLFRLQSDNKGVLPRNVGIFGTVGSGKSNTAQVLIEEAAACGWAVIVLDVESEYIAMDAASNEQALFAELARFDLVPSGLTDFHVFHPASCDGERSDSQAFTLRLADFETSVIAELLHATLPERNALLDCVEHFEQRGRSKMTTRDADDLNGLLDASPQAKLVFTLRSLRERAGERASRSTEYMDYAGLSSKLMWLLHSGAFDQPSLPSIDVRAMLQRGRVNVIDVSVANDVVKNLVTADLLRKTFAYKMLNAEAPPTLLLIEEAHAFISRERAQTMQATLHMLRNVTRRGRKRWLSVGFISQQPGHLPPEIFELCNTRIVHTLRSMHNLETLMSSAGDIGREMWDRCPLLGPGQAVVTSPQLKRPAIVSIRPARSQRKFVH